MVQEGILQHSCYSRYRSNTLTIEKEGLGAFDVKIGRKEIDIDGGIFLV
jgi:hypothetical protein